MGSTEPSDRDAESLSVWINFEKRLEEEKTKALVQRTLSLARRNRLATMDCSGFCLIAISLVGSGLAASVWGMPCILAGAVGMIIGVLVIRKSLALQAAETMALLPHDVAEYLAANAARIARLSREIKEFEAGLPHLNVLKGKTELYAKFVAACVARRLELQTEADAIITAVVAGREADVERRRIAAERERDLARIAELQKHVQALVPSSQSERFTQDLTPYVAVLQAKEHVGGDEPPPEPDRE